MNFLPLLDLREIGGRVSHHCPKDIPVKKDDFVSATDRLNDFRLNPYINLLKPKRNMLLIKKPHILKCKAFD